MQQRNGMEVTRVCQVYFGKPISYFLAQKILLQYLQIKNCRTLGNNKIAIYVCKKIIAMKTITGSPARKSQFFKRPQIRSRILSALNNNENLLVSAPRRVGKSSILLDLVDAPDENFYAVFVNTEAVTSSEEYFKVIMQAILDTDKLESFGFFDKTTKERLKTWASKIAAINIGGVGLELIKK
jgi:hypothetical protein